MKRPFIIEVTQIHHQLRCVGKVANSRHSAALALATHTVYLVSIRKSAAKSFALSLCYELRVTKSEENVERLLGCWDYSYTIAQWLEHRWPQARVPGLSPGGDSQFFLQTFPVCVFPSNK